MRDARAAVDGLDVEPGVERLREPELLRDVEAVRRVPPVPVDHGAGELAHERAILASHHAVGAIAELGDADDLRVGQAVLRGIDHEVEDLLRGDAGDGCRSFASQHPRMMGRSARAREPSDSSRAAPGMDAPACVELSR